LLVKYIFHEDIFSDLFCLVYFCLVLNKTPAATSRVDSSAKQRLFRSPPSRLSACLAPVRTSTKGAVTL
jgi:hypothetical protein